MNQTKNPAPGHATGDGASQAAKPDEVNHSTTHPMMQAAIATPARRVTVKPRARGRWHAKSIATHARRVTVDQHQAFREAIAPAPEIDDDDIDLDFIDRPTARRSQREIARLFAILDNLPPAREEMERSCP